MTKPTAHAWTFFRSGGFDQVRISTGADIAAIPQLDLKLWAALSCPVKGLEFDERTLELLDGDKDGRVRASEIIAAIEFVKENVKDLNALIPGHEVMPLTAINDDSESGKVLLACAKHVLSTQGRPEAPVISLPDVAKAVESFAKTPFNGDGIVSVDAADEPLARRVIEDALAVHGGEVDRNGKPGIGRARLDAFFADLAAYSTWWKGAEDRAGEVLVLGPATNAAVTLHAAIAGKVDDFFTRVRFAAFDQRAQSALNRSEKDFLDLASKDLVITSDEIRGFPLARVAIDAVLPLTERVNPAWAYQLAAYHAQVVTPLLGATKTTLAEADWIALKSRLASAQAWIAAKAGGAVEKLGLVRVRELLAGDGKARVEALIAKDLSYEREFNALIPLEKLVRLYRDLNRLLHNFVNFADFYSKDRMAVFQAGRLYLDSRACELVVRVDDAGKHGLLAGLSKTYLAYCDCTRPGSEKMTIAAAYTAGDSDYLMVGRNGVFYDRKGRDWDATITKVIDNPISIRQAFWSPYKKAIRFVEETIAKRAAAADDAANAKLTGGISQAAAAAEAGKAPAEKPKIDIGTVAALGVGLGAVGGFLSSMALGFVGLGLWMPLGIVGIVLAISGPSMLIAALKLRLRNLGPILDANGWAVNGRVKINIPFGGSLTELPRLPVGAHRALGDPYAEKKKPWKLWLTLAVLACIAITVIGYRLHYGRWMWEHAPLVVVAPAPGTTPPPGATPTPPPGTPPTAPPVPPPTN